MFKKVINFVLKHKLLQDQDKLVIGVSGGADSVALLHVLLRLKEEGFQGISFHVVHINHQLRGKEAEEDQHFVEQLCRAWGVPCESKSFPVAKLAQEHKKSLEEMARELRYETFEEVREKHGFNKIVVAHHKNDQAETILMNMIRGAGSAGLVGMLPQSDRIIRPFLAVSRPEIEAYCKDHKLSYRIDQTNFEDAYTRNKIRLKILPLMQEMNQNVIQRLSDLSELMQQEELYFREQVQVFYETVLQQEEKHKIVIHKSIFLNQHIVMQKRCLRYIFQKLKGNLKNIEGKHIAYAQQFIETKETGKQINLPDGLTISIKYDTITCYTGDNKQNKIQFQLKLEEGKDVFIPTVQKWFRMHSFLKQQQAAIPHSAITKWIDKDKIKGELVLRTRQPRDLFFPLGSKGKKKLKEYFIDKKVPREERDQIPLVTVGNEVLWIIGYEINEGYKITYETQRVLQMEVRDEES